MKSIKAAAVAAALLLCGCGTVTESGGSAAEQTKPAETANSSSANGADVGETTDKSVEVSSDESVGGEGYVPVEPDENGVYVAEGYASKLNYPLDEKSVSYAAMRFEYVYEQYLDDSGSKVYYSVIPDKNIFLAERNGITALDLTEIRELLAAKMDFAEYIDIAPLLELSDYYRTDTHWRQEKLPDVAAKLAEAMGVTLSAEYTVKETETPFCGVHCRQSEISAEPDTLVWLDNEILKECRVYDAETDSYIDVYNMELAAGDDPYEMFLSGAKSLLTIENPNAEGDRELIIFRDSFASSLAPLLAEGYSKITLVDIRYLSPALLGRFVDFHGQDVLFLYSTLVLNNSVTIK